MSNLRRHSRLSVTPILYHAWALLAGILILAESLGAAEPPVVSNQPADSITTSSARLRGVIESLGGEAPQVTIYWGAVDGGTEAAAWENRATLGHQADSFDTTITGLQPAMPYYYRSAATNSAGTAWAAETAPFATLPLSLPLLTMDNAQGITSESATLRATITDAGGSACTVTFYFGPQDGEVNANAWAMQLPAGPAAGPAVERFVGGLTPGARYYFRAHAANATGTAWGDRTRSFVAAPAEASQVVINEIFYQRPGKDPARPNQAGEYIPSTKAVEFIELHNPGASAVDLSGWRLASGVSYLFPAGTLLAAGGYVCVAQHPEHFQEAFGVGPLGPWTGALSRRQDTVELYNGANELVDEVSYQAGFPWPTAAKGQGESMELINLHLDNNRGGAWRASGGSAQIIPLASDGWHWRKGTSEASAPADAWRAAAFAEDASWFSKTSPEGGLAPFGFGVSGVTWGTTLTDMRQLEGVSDGYSSVYFRHPFTLPADHGITRLTLRLFVDDGSILWLNGTQINATRAPASPAYNAVASASATGNGGTAATVTVNNAAAILQPGLNVLAVQAFNQAINNSDFRFDLEMSSGAGANAAIKNPTPGRRNSVAASAVPPLIDHVAHTPFQPKENEPVFITARITDAEGVASASVSYQKVNPGSYIPLRTVTSATVSAPNASYEAAANWTTVAMRDDGLEGDAVAGDSIYTARIPASEQTHRRLIRYRISASDAAPEPKTLTVPYPDDEQPNFAYFCYNGIPAWTGAFRRTADAAGAATPAVTYPESLTRSMQAFHLLALANDVERSQYNSGFNSVRFYGTMVRDGVVYDHIQFNNRGDGSTYNTGKNKWRFHFNTARDCQVYDDRGQPWGQLRNGFSLGACAGPWATVNRGMAGLDEAIPSRLYELAGTPSTKTFYTQLRVIDAAAEASPSSQYETDLWGLYLGIEDYDRDWFQERDLPEGNIYKLQNSVEQKSQAAALSANQSDWSTFNSQSNASPRPAAAYWRAAMDLPAYYTFHSINRYAGNVDLRAMNNAYYYHRADDNRWVALPWDLDMMFISKTHWSSSYDGKSVDGVLTQHRLFDVPELKIELKNRAREFLDLLGEDASPSGGQMAQLIDEFAQIVNPSGAEHTWADIDAALWNQHPRTSGSASSSNGQNNPKGNFYRSPWGDERMGGNWRRWLRTPRFSGTAEHEDFVKYLVDYTTNTYPVGAYPEDMFPSVPATAPPAWNRNNAGLPSLNTSSVVQLGYGYKYLEYEAADTGVPERPAAAYAGEPGFPPNALRFTSSAFAAAATGSQGFQAMEWRIGEISAPGIPFYEEGTGRLYETTALWTSGPVTAADGAISIPPGTVRTGRTYRARVRHQDANGRWSRWSPAVQFVPGQLDVSRYRDNIMITEINYHPFDARPHELAAGFESGDFEFIEIKNIGAAEIDLTNVRFTKGIDADIPAGTVLAPGAIGLIVKNTAAFRLRYGRAYDTQIIATFLDGSLNNSGENLKLSLGAGTPIHEFDYTDDPPWPKPPDGNGPTLVLTDPPARPDFANGANWRASLVVGGSPGRDDTGQMTYLAWSWGMPGMEDASADANGDGVSNWLAYAVGAPPHQPATGHLPAAAVERLSVEGQPAEPYLVCTFSRPAQVADVRYTVQLSSTLAEDSWAGGAVWVSTEPGENNTVIEKWRSPQPMAAQEQWWVRVKAD